jgi:hypothetical protein
VFHNRNETALTPRPTTLNILSPTHLSLSSNNIYGINSKSNTNFDTFELEVANKIEKLLPKNNSQEHLSNKISTNISKNDKPITENIQINNSSQNISKDFKSDKNFSDLIINELKDLEKKHILTHSLTSSSISNDLAHHFLAKSPSTLTINKTLSTNTNDGDTCPLASEEQSCMSTPNLTKLSPSIDSIYKQQQSELNTQKIQQQQKQQQTQVNATLFRPNQLDLIVKNYTNQNNSTQVLIKVQSPSNHDPSPSILGIQQNIKAEQNCNFDFAPHITIQCENDDARSLSNYESDFNRLDNSRSPSFLGYMTSASSVAITHSSTNNEIDSIISNNNYNSKKQKGALPPLLLPPPSHGSQRNKISFNSSSSSNNLSSHKLSVNEFSFSSSLGNFLISYMFSFIKYEACVNFFKQIDNFTYKNRSETERQN